MGNDGRETVAWQEMARNPVQHVSMLDPVYVLRICDLLNLTPQHPPNPYPSINFLNPLPFTNLAPQSLYMAATAIHQTPNNVLEAKKHIILKGFSAGNHILCQPDSQLGDPRTHCGQKLTKGSSDSTKRSALGS